METKMTTKNNIQTEKLSSEWLEDQLFDYENENDYSIKELIEMRGGY